MRYQGSFPGTPDSVAEIRRTVGGVARDCGLSPERVHEVRLAVSEAASNAIVHAYGGERRGDVTLTIRDGEDTGEFVVTIADTGGGVVPRPDSPGLGLGLPLIVALTTRMEICNDDGVTEVLMAFECPRSEARAGV